VSQYQKGKTNLDFSEAKDSEWQWHQLGHMKMKMKIVYSVWQQCMLDSHNYNKIQTQIRQ